MMTGCSLNSGIWTIFVEYAQALKKEIPRLIISGDYNICHQPIDIHDPVRLLIRFRFLTRRTGVADFLYGNRFYR